ncbi:regulatory particle non-ATPase [Pichia californica]|uniref:Regulatory particle non-ATPase n=1 Tax=Pichia californica TaxID=460514 RepID=A0A9P7BIC8_9ASCO|nr:regulatory particle non-ATPase [[Candida] californica]KAG0691444.1 regulatory particle non-ATPase [[Candida] californica]
MSLETLTTKLTENFSKEDYESCYKLLTPIKIQLIEHNLLVPSNQSNINPNDLIITRAILEIGALVSINLLKMQEFSNFITQLKPFYELKLLNKEEFKSNEKNKLLSLYLLLLLTRDDLALFHIELESFKNFNLNIDDLENDEFLSIPIKFEKWIIDGDFNKIFEILSLSSSSSSSSSSSKTAITTTTTKNQKFPCKEFNLFENELLNSIRINIATNLEKVYKNLPIENFKLILFLKEISETYEYIENFNWTLNNGIVDFTKKNFKIDEENNIIDEINDEKTIIKNSLIYATEMESII